MGARGLKCRRHFFRIILLLKALLICFPMVLTSRSYNSAFWFLFNQTDSFSILTGKEILLSSVSNIMISFSLVITFPHFSMEYIYQFQILHTIPFRLNWVETVCPIYIIAKYPSKFYNNTKLIWSPFFFVISRL